MNRALKRGNRGVRAGQGVLEDRTHEAESRLQRTPGLLLPALRPPDPSPPRPRTDHAPGSCAAIRETPGRGTLTPRACLCVKSVHTQSDHLLALVPGKPVAMVTARHLGPTALILIFQTDSVRVSSQRVRGCGKRPGEVLFWEMASQGSEVIFESGAQERCWRGSAFPGPQTEALWPTPVTDGQVPGRHIPSEGKAGRQPRTCVSQVSRTGGD